MYFATLPLALALGLSYTLGSTQDPAPTYELKWKIAVGQTIETKLLDDREEQSSVTIRFGDQEPQPQENSNTRHVELSWRDQVKAVKDGVAVKVVRKYGDLERKSEFGEHEVDIESPLEDQEIGIDESGDEVELTLPEDLELKESIEKAIRIQSKLGGFLPSAAVAVGASWELDGTALNELLECGRGWFESEKPSFRVEGGNEIEIDSEEAMAQMPKPAADKWEGECKLVSIDEVEGRKVATIQLVGKCEPEDTASDSSIEAGEGGGNVMIMIGGNNETKELKGEMRFDLDGGFVRAVELEIEGEGGSTQEHEAEFGTIEFISTSTSTRKVEFSVAVSTAK